VATVTSQYCSSAWFAKLEPRICGLLINALTKTVPHNPTHMSTIVLSLRLKRNSIII
jgi:hypothetical protein